MRTLPSPEKQKPMSPQIAEKMLEFKELSFRHKMECDDCHNPVDRVINIDAPGQWIICNDCYIYQ